MHLFCCRISTCVSSGFPPAHLMWRMRVCCACALQTAQHPWDETLLQWPWDRQRQNPTAPSAAHMLLVKCQSNKCLQQTCPCLEGGNCQHQGRGIYWLCVFIQYSCERSGMESNKNRGWREQKGGRSESRQQRINPVSHWDWSFQKYFWNNQKEKFKFNSFRIKKNTFPLFHAAGPKTSSHLQ